MILEREYVKSAATRFKEEHRELLVLLYRIQTLATQAMKEEDPNLALHLLYESKDDVLSFLKNLSAHAKWEEESWYPLLREYCRENLVPHSGELLDTVEEDHFLARMFAESFIARLERIVPPVHREEVQNAAATLNQTCYVLWEHFAREEELMEPVVVQAEARPAQFRH
jgi:regulator of cell morphogenesis and NO signaling